MCAHRHLRSFRSGIVNTPDGKRKRKYVYDRTRDVVHTKWLTLLQQAAARPVATRTPNLKEYLTYWLDQVVRTSLKPKTAETYAMHVRLYIIPGLGEKRLDKPTVRDVRGWLNRLGEDCQCCAPGKDVTRPPKTAALLHDREMPVDSICPPGL